MKVITDLNDYRHYRKSLNVNNIGFVPTMGALHQGHLSLVNRSVNENNMTVVSIYINATQFDNDADLTNYPNTLDKDLALLKEAQVDAVFLPNYQQMYPDDYRYKVQEKLVSKKLCGAHRDGHFDGVLSVVMKLFNIVKPTKAYFGQKDHQQLSLIKGMVKAFFLDIKVIGCPIIREEDGLAMSSRNLRLNQEQRVKAVELYKTISSDISITQMKLHLENMGFDVDYIEVLDGRLLAAATLGEIRLIDNVAYKTT